MKIEITRATFVRVKAGTVLEVEEHEGQRLIALGNGKKAEEPKPKKTTKRAAK